MTKYYFESKCFFGDCEAETDEEAIKLAFSKMNSRGLRDTMEIIYKESETVNGVPFITVWGDEENE